MATNTKKPSKQAPKQAAQEEQNEATGDLPRNRRERLIQKLLLVAEEKLAENAGRATVGDLIRLLQLEDEMEKGRPTRVEVLWVEPGEREEDAESK